MVNRLGVTSCVAVGVENDEEFFVKPPEGSGTEVELPQRGTDGFEADELVAQRRSLSTPVRHSWELIREQSPVW